MANVQKTIINISYKGPFSICQTAPFSFTLTERNIALTQPQAISKRIPTPGNVSALKISEAEDSVD